MRGQFAYNQKKFGTVEISVETRPHFYGDFSLLPIIDFGYYPFLVVNIQNPINN